MERNKKIQLEESGKIDKTINSIMLELIRINKTSKKDIGDKRNFVKKERDLNLRDFLKSKLETLCVECEIGKRHQLDGECRSLAQGDFVTTLDKTLELYYSDSTVKVRDIASSLAMSERQLYRKIKSSLYLTPSEYLKLFRLRKAQNLLSQGNVVNRVAFEVGFNSHAYFSRCFKTQFGKLPSEYKKHCTESE